MLAVAVNGHMVKGSEPYRLPSGPSNSMARDNMSKNRGKATLKTVVRKRENVTFCSLDN